MFAALQSKLRDSNWALALADTRIGPAWGMSVAVHVLALVIVSLLSFVIPAPFELTLLAPVEPLAEVPDEFHFSNTVEEDIGALSNDGSSMAMASSPDFAEIAELEQARDMELFEIGDVRPATELELATTPLESSKKLIHGVAGVGVTGASGAIDRITHEILISLEDRDTLVVWLFDQSGSLEGQREEIQARLARIYEELDLLQGSDLPATSNRHPLLTAVMAFGKTANWMIDEPTSDAAAIQAAVGAIKLDDSGVENVFSSVYSAAEKFKRWRSRRNIMLVVVSDEVGDDSQRGLEKTVETCRRYAMPVYVLGVPAAFGQSETYLKWVDPNPEFDQRPRWGRVSQGPESLRPERVHLPFSSSPEEPIDSGFGPYALTRLCYQTGGIYFTIHPNRRVGRRVGRRETAVFTSHIAHFFDPQRMRPYRPDYVAPKEYYRQAQQSATRTALLKAAQQTIQRLESPQLRFVKRDDAQFARTLTEAQKSAAKLEPRVRSLLMTLKQGETERDAEQTLRWQAAYDLAYGQTLAVYVRTRAYNEMLAMAKRGLKAEKEKTNTWTLTPSTELTVSSRLEREAERAKQYLSRVVADHEGTPWALLASRELASPMGWSWKESFTPQPKPRQQAQANNNNPPMPRDDERRMIKRRPPRREIPKL